MINLDIHQTVYDLVKEQPQLRNVMINLGFTPLANDFTFNLMAKKISLAKAIQKHNISLEVLNEALKPIGLKGIE